MANGVDGVVGIGSTTGAGGKSDDNDIAEVLRDTSTVVDKREVEAWGCCGGELRYWTKDRTCSDESVSNRRISCKITGG